MARAARVTVAGDSGGRVVAVLPRPAKGWAMERLSCLHPLRVSAASQAGQESPGPLCKKVCMEEMSVEMPSPNSSQLRPLATCFPYGCLWKRIMGQAQGLVHCEPGS